MAITQQQQQQQQQKDVIFMDVDPENPVMSIESLCMNCHETGTTRLMLTKIPHFREIVVMAFDCPHCGYRNNEIQSASAIQDRGLKEYCKVENSRDVSRQIVKSESATVRFVELDFEIPPSTQRGVLSTLEGLIDHAIEGLSQEQPVRKHMQPEVYEKVQTVIDTLTSYKTGDVSFTIIVDDPSGNSYIENLEAPKEDPKLKKEYYHRTAEQNEVLGFQTAPPNATETITEEPSEETKKEEEEKKKKEEEDNAPLDLSKDLAFKEEVHTFPGVCSRCHAPCDTKMHMLDIPYFKEVIIWATNCDECGYRSNEVKAGGAFPAKGRRITLRMTSSEDLNRDILKSETCGLKIPEADLELNPGTLGGRFTTIEGLLQQIKDELTDKDPFATGDAANKDRKDAFNKFLHKLDSVIQMENPPYTIILDDPLSNSHLQNLYAPDPDPEMTIEDYERTFDQNEDLGLNDINLGESDNQNEEESK